MKVSHKLLLLAITSAVSTSVLPNILSSGFLSSDELKGKETATSQVLHKAGTKHAMLIAKKQPLRDLADATSNEIEQNPNLNQEMLYHLQDLVKALEIKLKHVENLAFKLEKHGQVINKQLENAHSKLQQDHDRILDAANNVQMTAQATGQQLSKELNDKLTKFQKEAQKKSEKSKKFTRGKMVGGSAGL